MGHRTFIAAAVLTALIASASPGQLSGNYTIASSLPAGPGNYQSFVEAVIDLITMGVGPLGATFTVLPGASPYAGFFLPQIAGTSAATPLVFIAAPGTTPTISGPAPGFEQAVRFGTGGTVGSPTLGSGPSYATLDGFEITGAPAGAAFLALGCNFVTVRNCVAHSSGSGIGLTSSTNCTVEDCEVYGTAHTPGSGGSSNGASGAIFVYFNSSANVIQRNRIHDSADNGIFVGSGFTNVAAPNNIVINNFIWNCGTQWSYAFSGGIALHRATGAVVCHNSISMPATSYFPGIFVMVTSLSSPLGPQEISNNLIQHVGTGPCLQFDWSSFPAVLDYNLYDTAGGGPLGGVGVGSGSPALAYTDLPAWQVASGGEASAVTGSAAFVAPHDLHITLGSAGFGAGGTVTSISGGVIVDIDGQARPLAGGPDIGADETSTTGILVAFSGTPTSGLVPLTVNFTDGTVTSDPGGIISWAWDFDDDGVTDSTLPNPSFTYTAPGTYSVRLTATDLMTGSATHTESGCVTVLPYVFTATTSGLGDLVINPIPHAQVPSAIEGYMLVSFDTSLAPGSGPLFGLIPDIFTWSIVPLPATPGNVLHWIYVPGLWPDIPLTLPPGSLANFIGISVDFVQIDLAPGLTIAGVSNPARVTF